MRIAPEITGVTLVLIGNFNPAIFAPAWFGWHNLLPEKAVEAAELRIVQPQMTSFQAEWLELQVLPDRFSISSAQPPFIRLRDLAIRVFQEQLPHTRLRSMGINRQIHFLVDSIEQRDRIGRQLAPIGPWGEWGRLLEPDGRRGGMTSLTMTQIDLDDRSAAGRINVMVQPSNRIGQEGTGIYVQVNDHYEVEDPDSRTATSDLVSVLEMGFEESLCRADRIIDHLMSLREE